jgi:hypothetical protein
MARLLQLCRQRIRCEPHMTKPETTTATPFRLRATAAGSQTAGTSSLLRVARTNTLDRRASVLQAHHAPRQLAFDFYRNGK